MKANNLRTIGIVATISAVTTITTAVAVKVISKRLKENKAEMQRLEKKIEENNKRVDIVEEINDASLEVIKKHLDSTMTDIKEDIHRAVSSVIEKKFEASNQKSLERAKTYFEDINESIEVWKTQITPALTEKVIENVKEEMVRSKLDVSEDVIKAMLFQVSRSMVDEMKDELQEYQEGLTGQYIEDANRELNTLKSGIRQILIIECIKSGLTGEQAELAVTQEKVQEVISEMSGHINNNQKKDMA